MSLDLCMKGCLPLALAERGSTAVWNVAGVRRGRMRMGICEGGGTRILCLPGALRGKKKKKKKKKRKKKKKSRR